jgi:integrase/recombinase XerD
MITFTPYYREDRKMVVVRIIANGQIAKVINTGIRIEKKEWDEKNRCVRNHPNKNIFNQKIQKIVADYQLEIMKAELLGVQLTKDRVKRLAEGGKVTTIFYDHCEKWIEEKYANKGTRNAAMSDLRKINTYAPSLQFGDIDARWLTKYERYLREELKNEGNTPWKSIKFVRTMLYDAQKVLGMHLNNPFRTGEYKMPRYKNPEKDGLYLHELDQLEKLLHEPHPIVIKIITAKFLFMCYTGLRISDAKRFAENENVINGERVVITSVKTKIKTNLKVWKRLSTILCWLRENPDKKISDQKFNAYLATIQDLIEFNRFKITSHRGRHTFGCLLAESGVTEEEAMELMGVKNKNIVRVYFKLRQQQVDKAAEKLNRLA